MTGSPNPPRRSPRGPLLVAIFVAGAAVVVGAVLLVSRLASSAPIAASTAHVVATTAEVTTAVTPPAFVASAAQVDAVIAADGHPLDLADDFAHHPDAYALIKDDCETMASGTTSPQQWPAAHLLNASIPGEAAALRLGIPLVCPEYNQTVLAVEGS